MADDNDTFEYDSATASRHIQAIMDQAHVVMAPDGFELLAGKWEDGTNRLIISFQRDYGSAFNSLVIVATLEDASDLRDMITQLLDALPHIE